MKSKIFLILFLLTFIIPFRVQAASLWQDGTLLKTADSPKVYIVYNNIKRWLKSPTIFNSYDLKWSAIKTVKKDALDLIPEAVLIRYFNQPQVYLLEAGQKRWIVSPKVFEENGYLWQDIHLVNQTELDKYQTGNLITEKIIKEPEEKIVKPITTPTTTPPPISTPTPTPVTPPISTEKKVISLVPPANWTDELKREWNDNIEEVRRVAEGIQQRFLGWNWESLHNEDLPKLIQWGTEHGLIKLVYGGAFESEKAPKIAIPGVNAVFEALSAMPSHLISMLEGGVGGRLYLMNKFESCGSQAGCYSSGAFYITICPDGTGDMHTTAHELGHIVDCIGIRNEKGNEFSFEKTDERINNLRKEYERIFQPSSDPLSDYLLKENFAGWFSDYITPSYALGFRREAARDLKTAEKYEFLKTKIFLGKEY